MELITEIMTPDPLKVAHDLSVAECRERMALRGHRHLPVVDADGAVIGILSDHAVHLTPDDAMATAAAVPVPTCTEQTPVGIALQQLLGTTLDCLIVIGSRSEPVGILTEHDVVRLAPALLEADPLALRRPDRVLDTTAPWSPRSEAFSQMVEGGFRHLPVVDGAEVVGVVTLRDLLAAGVTRGVDGPIEEVMSSPVDVAIEGIPFSEAAVRMAKSKVGCLPILDFAHRPVGILTRSDIVAQVAVNLL